MPYEPMPILDFEGISQEREALISPENAFQSISNGHVRRGRLHKRDGYGHKQKLGVSYTDQIGVSGSTNYTFSIPDLGLGTEILRPLESYEAGYYNITVTADWASGTMTYVVGPDSDTLTIHALGTEFVQYRFTSPPTGQLHPHRFPRVGSTGTTPRRLRISPFRG